MRSPALWSQGSPAGLLSYPGDDSGRGARAPSHGEARHSQSAHGCTMAGIRQGGAAAWPTHWTHVAFVGVRSLSDASPSGAHVLWLYLIGPACDSKKVVAEAPHQRPEFTKPDGVGGDAEIGLQAPTQVGALPWAQAIASHRAPQEREHQGFSMLAVLVSGVA